MSQEINQRADDLTSEKIKESYQLPDANSLKKALDKLGNNIQFPWTRRKTLNEAYDLLSKMDSKYIGLRQFDLISAALNAGANQSQAIQDFISLMDIDFRAFAECELRENGIVAYQRLKQMLSKMEVYATCPSLQSRTIISVGGGFSSGKSAFINSLLLNTTYVKLAEGIRPVTAIPSYVVHDSIVDIQGINSKGVSFGINQETYREITHELLKALPFLRDIMPYIIVRAPMQHNFLEQIAFIDTPGYNPAAVGLAENDPEKAREYIKDASALIWLVGLDCNGTIPQSDIEFITGLGFGSDDRKLYILANKAELKTTSEIENILDVFEECLDDNGIAYAGISPYSTKRKVSSAPRGQGLFDFLEESNIKREHYKNLISDLCDVFRPYVATIRKDDHEKTESLRTTRALLMEAFKQGALDDDDGRLEQGLLSLEKNFYSDNLKKRIDRAKTLFDLFVQCLDAFGTEVGMSKLNVSKQIKELFDMSIFDPENKISKGNKISINVKAPPSKDKPKRKKYFLYLMVIFMIFSGIWFYHDEFVKFAKKIMGSGFSLFNNSATIPVVPAALQLSSPREPDIPRIETVSPITNEGFSGSNNPSVALCIDERVKSFRQKVGADTVLSHEAYNEFASSCGYKISESRVDHSLHPVTPQDNTPAVHGNTEPVVTGEKVKVVYSILHAASKLDWNFVDEQIRQLFSSSIPVSHGDRKAARLANSEGHEALLRNDIATAIVSFSEGIKADPSDIEIRNNLGYSYILAKDFQNAIDTLVDVLYVAPERSSAWANLSDVFSRVGKINEAKATLRLTVRYSSNRQRTIEFLTKIENSHEVFDYRDVARQVLLEMDYIPEKQQP